MPEGRAALALAPAGSVRRLLAGAAAPTLSLILLGCSPTGGARREASGGGSSPSHGDDSGGGGAGGALSMISGLEPGPAGGPGGGHGGAQTSSEDGSWGTAAFNLGTPLDGYGYGYGYGGYHSASASSSTTGAGTGAGAGGGAGAGAGGGAAPCDPTEAIDTSPTVPALLSATGLYQSIAAKTLSPGVLPFTPQFPLWSDGAEKRRWVHLPACAKIDTSDMDRWEMPVGTKIWKEFSVNGARVETRYLHRWGPGINDYVFQAYQWNQEASDATPVDTGGVKNANGTTHDIPGEWECEVCHGHAPERVLGLSAIQLSHGGPGLTIASLSAAGRLTAPSAGFTVPGNTTARAALGYLHGNCAHCHNTSPNAVGFSRPYSLKLLTTATSVGETDAFLTAVGVAPEKFEHPGITHRITAGDPASSCVAYRMSVRGSDDAMPALGTEVVDQDGLARINAWISELPP